MSNFEVSIDIECDILTDVNKLNIFNINIDRKSCDKKTIIIIFFFFGNQLLNFCKTNSLYIMNGRVQGDTDSSNFTTTRASVVDYLLQIFLSLLNNLKYLYSDIHMPLTCQLSCKM